MSSGLVMWVIFVTCGVVVPGVSAVGDVVNLVKDAAVDGEYFSYAVLVPDGRVSFLGATLTGCCVWGQDGNAHVMSDRGAVFERGMVYCKTLELYDTLVIGGEVVVDAGGSMTVDGGEWVGVRGTILEGVFGSLAGDFRHCDFRDADFTLLDVSDARFRGCVFGPLSLAADQCDRIAVESPGLNAVVGLGGVMHVLGE